MLGLSFSKGGENGQGVLRVTTLKVQLCYHRFLPGDMSLALGHVTICSTIQPPAPATFCASAIVRQFTIPPAPSQEHAVRAAALSASRSWLGRCMGRLRERAIVAEVHQLERRRRAWWQTPRPKQHSRRAASHFVRPKATSYTARGAKKTRAFGPGSSDSFTSIPSSPSSL
jgi:hypothetical protein